MRRTLRAVGPLLVAALALTGCHGQEAAPAPAPATAAVAPAAPAAPTASARPSGELPGASVYQLQPSLTDQRGERVAIGLHRGHPTVVAMFYATCPVACPMMIADLRKLENGLPPEARKELRVLLVSLDPDRDGPEAFRDVIERHGIDGDRWTLVRSKPTEVREIAAALGIQYRRLQNGEFHHSSLLTLLDCDGAPVVAAEGGGEALAGLREALIAATGCPGSG